MPYNYATDSFCTKKLLFIYYSTKAAQENTNIETYKTYKKRDT